MELKTSTDTVTDIAEIPGIRTVWEETLGDPRICVALLDGPIDHFHPAFIGSKLALASTVIPNLRKGKALRHGTQVTSVIFGQHNAQIKGIAPGCRGLVIPIVSDGSNGLLASYSQVGLAQAISMAIQAGANIINISLGQRSPEGVGHPLLLTAIEDCLAKDVVIVAATGNEGRNTLSIPAALPSVLAVGAMNSQGLPLEFSNWHERYQTQGVLAPGENILTADLGNAITLSNGTSYAAAIVSGVIALLASLQIKHGLPVNFRAIREAILNSALGCEGEPVKADCRLLAGRLNINGAKLLLLKGMNTMNMKEVREPKQATNNMPYSSEPSLWLPASKPQPNNLSGNLSPFPIEIDDYSPGSPTSQNSMMANSATTCNCGRNGSVQLVFALGKLGIEFETEARFDSIRNHMEKPDPKNEVDPNPYDPEQLLNHFTKNPWDAASVIWTLNLDAVPIYAIKPEGAFAQEAYQELRNFLNDQINNSVERVSVPGYIVGNIKLKNGQMIPVINPDLRGMYSWNTQELIEKVCAHAAANQEKSDRPSECKKRVENFIVRVYEELRNLGITPQDRAINYAASNALLVAEIFKEALQEGLEFGSFIVERSPVCRPESDCWDIKLTFFNPKKIFEEASKVYLLTVDVSDVVPVMVGRKRSWFVYVRP
ncbi:MAG: PatA/PatG family cyanobactin maturation protease [Candidatus Competibacteraceae bacterium]|nr:PatA/PatG family cyanobactin maturation protease [Candidatus Competibacteraceae bacterium]